MFISVRKLTEIDGCSAALEKLQTGTCSKTKCTVTVVLLIICELSVHIQQPLHQCSANCHTVLFHFRLPWNCKPYRLVALADPITLNVLVPLHHVGCEWLYIGIAWPNCCDLMVEIHGQMNEKLLH
jgi:hypothetical protein